MLGGNGTWLITSELANQRAPKALFASSVSITVTAMLSVTTTTTVNFICTNITLQKRGKYDNYGNLVISWELSRLTIRVARDPENKRREGEVVCS